MHKLKQIKLQSTICKNRLPRVLTTHTRQLIPLSQLITVITVSTEDTLHVTLLN